MLGGEPRVHDGERGPGLPIPNGKERTWPRSSVAGRPRMSSDTTAPELGADRCDGGGPARVRGGREARRSGGICSGGAERSAGG
jgi:hypothetical protein